MDRSIDDCLPFSIQLKTPPEKFKVWNLNLEVRNQIRNLNALQRNFRAENVMLQLKSCDQSKEIELKKFEKLFGAILTEKSE